MSHVFFVLFRGFVNFVILVGVSDVRLDVLLVVEHLTMSVLKWFQGNLITNRSICGL